jgi:transcriptional regulator with XRE-family HTH domain
MVNPGKLTMPRPIARTHASSWVRSARRAAGLTQEQAVELLGVDARQVRRWESGESPMGALELMRRAGVQLGLLDGGEG